MAAVFTAGEQGRPFAMTGKARASLIEAAAESKVLLSLTEAPEELADRLAATGALEQYAASWRRDKEA